MAVDSRRRSTESLLFLSGPRCLEWFCKGEPMPISRILVLRGGAVGDFILTLPALQALRKRWPSAYIEIIGYPHIACLAQRSGLIDGITSLDKAWIARFFSIGPSISGEQAEYVESFDLILSYLYDPDETILRNLSAAGARQVIYGDPIVKNTHAVEHLMKPLETLAIYPEEPECPNLELWDSCLENGRRHTEKYGSRVLAMHPGSGSLSKNWPIGRFVRLAEQLSSQSSVTSLFIIGEADSEISGTLDDWNSRVPVLSQCSLLELAEVLSACKGYVGNDSGVTHLAASLGIPVVALYGPTDPGIWGPRGPNVRIIRAANVTTENLAAIPVEKALSAVEAFE